MLLEAPTERAPNTWPNAGCPLERGSGAVDGNSGECCVAVSWDIGTSVGECDPPRGLIVWVSVLCVSSVHCEGHLPPWPANSRGVLPGGALGDPQQPRRGDGGGEIARAALEGQLSLVIRPFGVWQARAVCTEEDCLEQSSAPPSPVPLQLGLFALGRVGVPWEPAGGLRDPGVQIASLGPGPAAAVTPVVSRTPSLCGSQQFRFALDLV